MSKSEYKLQLVVTGKYAICTNLTANAIRRWLNHCVQWDVFWQVGLDVVTLKVCF